MPVKSDKPKQTRDEMLKNLKRLHNEKGRLTENILYHCDYCPTLGSYNKEFGSMDVAIEMIGINVKENRKIALEELGCEENYILDKLKEYTIKYGYPTVRGLNKHKSEFISARMVTNIYWTVKNAIDSSDIAIPKEKEWLYDRGEYSRDELLHHLKIQTDIKLKTNLHLLNTDDVDKIKDMPSMTAYYNHFKSLDDAYKNIGINYNEFNTMRTNEDMMKKYNIVKELIGRTPNSRDFDKYSLKGICYAAKTYIEHFGSISNTQKIMGDKPLKWGLELTDDELLKILVRAKNELGIVPTQKELEVLDYAPSLRTYTSRFGSYVQAIRKAGLIPRSKKHPLITPNGNRAYSGYEFKFLLMLEKYNFKFKKEEFYKCYIQGFGKNSRFDFVIEYNKILYFIEIFGLVGRDEYVEKTNFKIKACKDNNLKLIALFPDDIGYKTIDELYELLIKEMEVI